MPKNGRRSKFKACDPFAEKKPERPDPAANRPYVERTKPPRSLRRLQDAMRAADRPRADSATFQPDRLSAQEQRVVRQLSTRRQRMKEFAIDRRIKDDERTLRQLEEQKRRLEAQLAGAH